MTTNEAQEHICECSQGKLSADKQHLTDKRNLTEMQKLIDRQDLTDAHALPENNSLPEIQELHEMQKLTDKLCAHKTKPWLFWALLGALAVLLTANLFIGATSLSVGEVFRALFSANTQNDLAKDIILYARLPRIAAAVAVGAALSCSGLLLQAMLNNSLASPGIIGINSGAGLAVVLASLCFPYSLFARSVGAFFGAFVTAVLIYGISKLSGAGRGTIILAGIAVSRLFSAVTDTVVLLDPTSMSNKAAFSVGSLSSIYSDSLSFALPAVAIGLVLSIVFSRKLDILVLGDDVACSLGLNVKFCRFCCIILSALLASSAVSLAGLLGFLGLIAPHIARKLVGTSHYRRLTVITVLLGADLTLLCDLCARTLFAPAEIPVGVVMTVLGVPFFLFLLFCGRRRNRYDAN